MPYNNEPSDLIEFLGFAPDADPNLPGTWSDCTLIIPNHRGFQTPFVKGPYADLGVTAALASYNPHFAFQGKPNGTNAIHIVATGSTAGNLHILQTHGQDQTLVDITSIAGGYTAGQPAAFSGVQFGDHFIVSGPLSYTLSYVSSVSATMTQVPDGPRATALVVAERFVVALGTNYLDEAWQGDRWHCCARDDHTSWTAAPSTQCATGRLPDGYGAFTGAIVLGNLIYAFKDRTCYVGRYVGPPEVWGWQEWPFRIGALSAPAHYKKTIIFLATDDLYQYDGANLRPLMEGKLSRWYATKNPATYRSRVVVDEARDTVYLGIASAGTSEESASTALRWLACHIPSGRWGKVNLPGIDLYFAARGSFWTGTGFGANEAESLWAVDDTGTIRFMDGVFSTSDATAQPSITLNDFGDAFADSEVSGARIKFLSGPEASTLIPMHRNTLDATLATLTAVERNVDGDFNYRHNARWHRLKFLFTAGTDRLLEMTGIRINSEPRGRR